MVKKANSDKNKSKRLLEAYGLSTTLHTDKAYQLIQGYFSDKTQGCPNVFGLEVDPTQDDLPFAVGFEFHKINGTYYWQHKILGKGSFGEVALLEGPGRSLLALKMLKKTVRASSAQKELENEAAILEKRGELIGKGITPEGRPYILTELKYGVNLHDYIEDRLSGSSEVSSVDPLIICYEMAHGLRKFHEQNIIHRDWKAGNCLLVGEEGVVDLSPVDVGFAVQLESGTTHIDTYERVGTDGYMAPEILENVRNDELYSYYTNLRFIAYLLEQPIVAESKSQEESEKKLIATEGDDQESSGKGLTATGDDDQESSGKGLAATGDDDQESSGKGLTATGDDDQEESEEEPPAAQCDSNKPLKITEQDKKDLKALIKSTCELIEGEEALVENIAKYAFSDPLPDYQRNLYSINGLLADDYKDYNWALEQLHLLLNEESFAKLMMKHFDNCAEKDCYKNIVQHLPLVSQNKLRAEILGYIQDMGPIERGSYKVDALEKYLKSKSFCFCAYMTRYRSQSKKLSQRYKEKFRGLGFDYKKPPDSCRQWLKSEDVVNKTLTQLELSKKMSDGFREITSRPRTSRYSFASDIYALGQTFKKISLLIKDPGQKKKLDELIAKTISPKANDRPDIDAVMLELNSIICSSCQFDFALNRFVGEMSSHLIKMLQTSDQCYKDDRLTVQLHQLIVNAKNETHARVLYLEASYRLGPFSDLREVTAKKLKNIFNLKPSLPPDWQLPYKLCKDFIIPFRNALIAYKAGFVNWFRYSRDLYQRGADLLETLKSTENLDQAKQMIADFANNLPPNEQRLKGLIVESCKLVDPAKQKQAKVSRQREKGACNGAVLRRFVGRRSRFKFQCPGLRDFKQKITQVLNTCQTYLASDEATLSEQSGRDASHLKDIWLGFKCLPSVDPELLIQRSQNAPPKEEAWLDFWKDLDGLAMRLQSENEVVFYACRMVSFFYTSSGFARDSVAVQFATLFADLSKPPDSISDRKLLVAEFQEALDRWLGQLLSLVNNNDVDDRSSAVRSLGA